MAETMGRYEAGMGRRPRRGGAVQIVLVALVIALGVALLWVAQGPLARLLAEPEALQTWIAGLGPLGPAAIVGLQILQVFVAPLPGYPVVLASGLLFGAIPGAIYANIGIFSSGLLAAGAARRLGRPLVARLLSESKLRRLDRLLGIESGRLWLAILLLPTGDLPYFAAGLSRVPLGRFAAALAVARLPFTFVLTYAASRALTLPPTLFPVVGGVTLVVIALGYWQQGRIMRLAQRLLDRLAR